MSRQIGPCFPPFWQAQSWILAYPILGYLVWLLGPSLHFPLVLIRDAHERGTSRTIPPQNFLEISIYSDALLHYIDNISKPFDVESLPQHLKDAFPYLGNNDYSVYFLFALIQV